MKNYTASIMKGIAIISVVLGHCTTNNNIESFVNQYHLAVFFFVSVFFFKEKYLDAPRNFFIKKLTRLYIPFVIFAITFLIFHNILYDLHIHSNSINCEYFFKEIFHITIRMTSHDPLMGAMWFCSAMLITSCISWCGLKLASIQKGKLSLITKQIIIFTILVLFASACLYLWKLKSPYCLWQYMITSSIFFAGYLSAKINKYPLNKGESISIFIILIFILIILTKYKVYGRLQPANINNENPLIILIIATMGSVSIYLLALLIQKNKASKWIAVCGDYSFSIMLLHFLAFKIINLFQCIFYHYPFNYIANHPIINYSNPFWGIGYLISGCFIPIVITYCYSKIKMKVSST